MLILPNNPTALKKIMGDTVPCNVYLPLTKEETKALIQDFLKFIETCINRIRRPNNSVPKGAARVNEIEIIPGHILQTNLYFIHSLDCMNKACLANTGLHLRSIHFIFMKGS
jgi:hypothetical protein